MNWPALLDWLENLRSVASAVAAVVGVVVPLASLVCSKLNAAIRAAVENGYAVPRWLRVVGATLNGAAFNLDKVPQMAKGYRGPSAPPRSPTGEAP
jgi:hypothetical protein